MTDKRRYLDEAGMAEFNNTLCSIDVAGIVPLGKRVHSHINYATTYITTIIKDDNGYPVHIAGDLTVPSSRVQSREEKVLVHDDGTDAIKICGWNIYGQTSTPILKDRDNYVWFAGYTSVSSSTTQNMVVPMYLVSLPDRGLVLCPGAFKKSYSSNFFMIGSSGYTPYEKGNTVRFSVDLTKPICKLDNLMNL